MPTFHMSQKELDQVSIFEKLKERQLKQGEAAQLLRLSVRQVKRKLKRYRQEGAASLVHAARGKPSNRTFPLQFKEQVIQVVRDEYAGFAPTFAAEKLEELQGMRVNKETLRQWMEKAGLWTSTAVRQKEAHTWRERRASRGELVQADGSEHDWFEGRAPRCCLLAFIDDATSQVLWAEFAERETTESLMHASRAYLEKEGRPVSLYTDRGGVYKVNIHNEEKDKETQYERAVRELEIELIHARSPQAKGRIERLFGTLQDRLVKELRLNGIATMQEANRYLRDTYLPAHNARFAVQPRSNTDLHRSLAGFDLSHIFSLATTRTLTADWCLSYHRRWLQLEKRQPTLLTRGERIEIRQYRDGSLHLFLKGVPLAFRELVERPAKPAREKQLNVRQIPYKPAPTHPWRTPFTTPTHRDISKLLERDISILV